MNHFFKDEIDGLSLTQEEKKFINRYSSLMGAAGSKEELSTLASVISEINAANKVSNASDQLTRTIEQQVAAIIKSNTALAASNQRYSRGMLYLTFALVAVGILQIIY